MEIDSTMNTNSLYSVSEKKYGKLFKDHLFEQYKLYVESVEKVSDRRNTANNYFLAINGTVVSLLGLFIQNKVFADSIYLSSVLCFVGIGVSIVSMYLIRSYKQLNTGKFKVIHEIENELPLAIYKKEWEILKEGKDKKVYFPFSHIELFFPKIMIAIYGFVLIVMNWGFLNNLFTEMISSYLTK